MHPARRAALVALAATTLGFSTPASGTAQPPEPAAPWQLADQDREYIMESHRTHLAEVISGTRATTDGSCPLVRELGTMLVTDHTRLDARTVQVALPHLVPLPLTPNQDQVQQMWNTGMRIGHDFDLTWLHMQEDFHLQLSRAGADELRSGTSKPVIALARDAQPMIGHHLMLVREAIDRC